MENEIQSILANQYGIEVYRENLSEENLKQRGYRKATPEEVAHFNAFFQYAPQIAKDSYYASSAQEAFNTAVQGTYRLKLDPKYHLGTSAKTPGAFSGNAFDPDNNLKTQAEWFINDSKLNLSKIPEIASLAFHAASFATGQYFMAQINKNLSEIKNETQSIRHFLEVSRAGEIANAIDELMDIQQHLKYIESDPERRADVLNRLHNIQKTARIYVSHPRTAINDEKKKASDSDKNEVIKGRVDTITQALLEYRLLLWIFCQAKLIEIYLTHRSTEELELDREEMNRDVRTYSDTVLNSFEWIERYLNENHSLNGISPTEYLIMAGSGAAFAFGGTLGKIAGLRISDWTLGKATAKRRDKKRKQVAHAALQWANVDDGSVEVPVRRLSQYIEATRNKIEAIKIGDVIYTNLPNTENELDV